MLRPSPIVPTVDFETDGKQHGHLRLPYSRDDSAWGNILIPITVVRNGASGPTLLAIGGNHGDEYEGPLAILDLAETVRHEAISGRLILVPFLNYPAFRAGTRTSPLDRGNLNRLFPGAPEGTVTEKIADFVQHHLLPLADIVVDFHSGGRTLDFVPFAASHVLDDRALEARCEAAVAAFNAPYSVKMREIDAVGMLDTAVESMGKTFVTTELRGGGTATPASIAIARRGLRNLLIHTGLHDGLLERQPSARLDMPSMDCFVFAQEAGVLELTLALGDPVRVDQTVGKIWPLGGLGRAPACYRSALDGVLIARHAPGLIQAGDCLAVLGTREDD